MSTLAGETPSKMITSEQDLAHYFEAHTKPADGMLLGLEAEFLAVDARTGNALPYSGTEGISAILHALAKRFQYELVIDHGNVIALKGKDGFVSLEPGGQIELAAAPVWNVFQIESQVNAFLAELREIGKLFPHAKWLATAIHPFSSVEDIEWVPKTRYRIMQAYMGKHGSLSHEMMKLTATNQLNIDYLNETDAMEKFRTILGITSIVTAMFSNSSFSHGKPNGYLSRRLHIWNHTDPARCGLLTEFIHPGKTFQDYLEYILEMPMIFIVRGGQWIPLEGKTFREFIKTGHGEQTATLGDFELHLSTAFPEARIKQFIEIRGVDAQAPAMIPAVAAFWKGILYDQQTLQRAWALVKNATDKERMDLHQSVPKLGLQAKLGAEPILPIARELVDLACRSLAKQRTPDEPRDECVFLEKIREIITRPGKSPGQCLLEKWQGEWHGDKSRLIQYLSI